MTWKWKFKPVFSVLPDNDKSVREQRILPETGFHARTRAAFYRDTDGSETQSLQTTRKVLFEMIPLKFLLFIQ